MSSLESEREASDKATELIARGNLTVEEQNWLQNCGLFHPFTCGRSSCRETLVATEDGWRCPKCDYRQPFGN